MVYGCLQLVVKLVVIQKCNSTCVGTTILYLPKMEDILERAFAANNSISLSST